jgi:hypothetical protein
VEEKDIILQIVMLRKILMEMKLKINKV